MRELFPLEKHPQLRLGPIKDPFPPQRQVLSGSIYIEVEHRHRGTEGIGLAAQASFCRALKGQRDLSRA